MNTNVVAQDAIVGIGVVLGQNNIIHPTAKIADNVKIGDNNIISEFCSIEADIGNENYIDCASKISASIGSFNYIGIQAIIDSPLYNNHTIRHRQHSTIAKEQSMHPAVDSIKSHVKYCRTVLPKHLKLKQ
jgi:acyl-[acyl carrier protein]--UDP-N-acetylglucosamine O-acyltransferase